MARTSSWTGLPSMTPQVARGSPIRAASWSTSTVSSPARPGATSLGPPREPGEEVRLDEAGGDPHVGLDPCPVEPHRHARPVPAQPDQRPRVAGVVVDDPDRAGHGLAEHGPQLGVGVATVGAGGDQHDHVVEVDHAVQLGQHRRDHQVSGLRPGAVAGRDGHRLARPDPLAQRRTGHRGAQGGLQGRRRVGHGRAVHRLDHGGGGLLQLDIEPRASVGQPDPHQDRPGRPAGRRGRRCRRAPGPARPPATRPAAPRPPRPPPRRRRPAGTPASRSRT